MRLPWGPRAETLTNPALGLGSGLIKNARARRYPKARKLANGWPQARTAHPQFHAHNSRGARPVKILVTPRSFGKNNHELFDILRDAGLGVIRNDTGGILSEEAVKEKLAPCEGVILGVDPMNASVLAAAPKLRAIAKYGVGLDNIDLEACKARGIAVSRTVGANSNAVADYALTLMLTVARKAALIDRRCREKDWSKITGIDLYGKTLGIVGLGAIGKCVARRARGFDMKILAHDIAWDEAYAQEAGIERADVDRICREADFITLHTLLTDETRNLINAQRLAAMKKTAVLINTARAWMSLSRNPRQIRPGTRWTIWSWARIVPRPRPGPPNRWAGWPWRTCCATWACAERVFPSMRKGPVFPTACGGTGLHCF